MGRTRAAGYALAAISAAIVVAGAAVELVARLFENDATDELLDRFGLNEEGGVPAAWSTLLLLGVAALLAFEAVLARSERDREWRWWAALAGLFLLLGAEEYLALHELTIEPLRSALDVGGLLYFAWLVPGVALLLAACAIFAGFVRRMPAGARRPLLLGTLLMAVGGFGLEAVAGWWVSQEGAGRGALLLHTVEETLEIAGATLIVVGLLWRLDRTRITVPAPRR